MKEPIDNEPEIKIKGGAIRTSRRIERSEFPALEARERVVNVLRARDKNSPSCPGNALLESDAGLVRIIAQEGAISNAEPAVRYNAIAALASSAPVENLNLLIDLAQFGEDVYVRGHALLALGATGVQLALPAIAGHLIATDRFEQAAAARAVALIAQKTSVESVKAHASLLDDKSRAAVTDILAETGKVKPRRELQLTPQRKKERLGPLDEY
jgi:HEAT repeat protein